MCKKNSKCNRDCKALCRTKNANKSFKAFCKDGCNIDLQGTPDGSYLLKLSEEGGDSITIELDLKRAENMYFALSQGLPKVV